MLKSFLSSARTKSKESYIFQLLGVGCQNFSVLFHGQEGNHPVPLFAQPAAFESNTEFVTIIPRDYSS